MRGNKLTIVQQRDLSSLFSLLSRPSRAFDRPPPPPPLALARTLRLSLSLALALGLVVPGVDYADLDRAREEGGHPPRPLVHRQGRLCCVCFCLCVCLCACACVCTG